MKTKYILPALSYGKWLMVPDASNPDGFIVMSIDEFAAESEHITLSTDSEGLVQINDTCAVFSGFAPFTERTKYGADASGMCQEPGCIEPCYEGSSRCKSPRCPVDCGCGTL